MAKKKIGKTSAKNTKKTAKKAVKKAKKPLERQRVVKRATATMAAAYNEAAYQQLRECLAHIRGWPVSRVTEGISLEDDMGYDEGARKALAAELSDCFAKHGMPLSPLLKPAETGACDTVGDLDDLIQTRV